MNEVYINYYSKPRICNTPEKQQKEFELNKGKIATKRVHKEQIEIDYYKQETLRKLIPNIRSREYKSWRLPKKSGGFRTIESPSDELARIQRQFIRNIYRAQWLPHNAAHGFTKKRGIKTALEVHKRNKSRWFLKMDIHDFFGSTTGAMIETALDKVYPFNMLTRNDKSKIINLVTNEFDKLPQGAPTSPIMCNIVMTPYDYAITKYCRKHNLIYTRYADDILISSRVNWDWKKTYEYIKTILNPYTISEHKTRYGSFNGRNWNLGVMYTHNSDGEIILTVGHEKKHYFKNRVKWFEDRPDTLTLEEWYKLQGQISYALYIEPTSDLLLNLNERLKAIRPYN